MFPFWEIPEVGLRIYEKVYGVVPPEVELVNVTDCPASIVFVAGSIEIVGAGFTVTVTPAEHAFVGVAAESVTL